MKKRGMVERLPESVKLKAVDFFEAFGREELRFIPYLQYCAINEMVIDPQKVTQAERLILSDLRNKGLVNGGASNYICITNKSFWDFICDCLYYAYNDYIVEG